VIPVEDVTRQEETTIDELLGDAPEEPQKAEESQAEEPQAEETPPEKRKRLQAEHSKALEKIQKCESALADAKRAAGEIAKELQGLTEANLPLHELNRRAREINRTEDEQRIATREAIKVLNAGRRPGVQTRPPLFQAGAQKEE
jgi:small-conductance mechanosensitive channel